MTKQFAPMNKVKREPSGKFFQALIGPKAGQIGEAVTFHNWGGVSLQFHDGTVVAYADSDVRETGPDSDCAALESLLPQIATALRLAYETFDDDAPGDGVSEKQAIRLLSDAHRALRDLYGCACGYTDPYGWVPEAGCPLHDPKEQER
jgi:hypothetical protein